MHISQKFNLEINGHKDIDFIDIDETLDTRLFIDPYVLQALPDELCLNACRCIDTFFQQVFQACHDQNRTRLRSLLEYASEPNETNLGMKSISNYGKGTTADELTSMFLEFYKIVRRNPYTESNPLALCMYIQNFDKDKMSDLITNILRKLLYDFTIEQSITWNMKLKPIEEFIGYYWDYNKLSWNKLYGNPLSVGHKNILLVPKVIVRSRYVFNVECYIKQYILKNIQQEHADNNTDMCTTKEYADGRKIIVPPSKKELYKYEVHGTVHKDYAFKFSSKNKRNEDDFVKDIFKRINEGYGSITDSQLDIIVYGRNTMTA